MKSWQHWWSSPLVRRAALAALFATALAVRLVEWDNPCFSFHSTRQYRSAIIARAYYYGMTASDAISPARRQLAELAATSVGRLEPSITEALAALGYLARGGEDVAVPRLLTCLFWLAGGFFLFRLARRLSSERAAFVGLAGYLFLPYGIVASRSFQPDPLMVCMLCTSLEAICAHDEAPSARRLAYACATSAFAILVKPVCIFEIFALFAALLLRRVPARAWFLRADGWVFLFCALTPVVAYYAYGIVHGGTMASQANSSFRPELWGQAMFRNGWLNMLQQVFGFPALWAALAGVAASRGRTLLVLLALAAGYLVYGFTFSYHIFGHNYYQLPLVPVVALAWAALAEAVFVIVDRVDRVDRVNHRAAHALLALGLCALAYVTASQIATTAFRQLRIRDDARMAMYRELGRKLGHSARVVFLSPDAYGEAIQFYGELGGWYWPTRRDAYIAHQRGAPALQPVQRLRALITEGARFFVMTSRSEFARQPVLVRTLQQEFTLWAEADSYLVYDLQRPRRAH